MPSRKAIMTSLFPTATCSSGTISRETSGAQYIILLFTQTTQLNSVNGEQHPHPNITPGEQQNCPSCLAPPLQVLEIWKASLLHLLPNLLWASLISPRPPDLVAASFWVLSLKKNPSHAPHPSIPPFPHK